MLRRINTSRAWHGRVTSRGVSAGRSGARILIGRGNRFGVLSSGSLERGSSQIAEALRAMRLNRER
jgi:hypothetical protein